MKYQLLLTNAGAALIASAANNGGSVQLTDFVIGQADNVDFSQRLHEQSLVSPCYRAKIEGITPTLEANQYSIVCVVPSDVGDFTIRELGLINDKGVLVWVGQLPSVQKPVASNGAVDYRINVVISIDNPQVTIAVDTNVVTASKTWVNANFVTHPEFNAHLQADDPHPQYAKKDQVNHQLDDLSDHINNDINPKFEDIYRKIEALSSRPYEAIGIGGIYTTTKLYNNGDEVAADLRYGKWILYGQGRTLVGYSTQANDIADYKTMGNRFGENTHTLTIAEMPSHKHEVALGDAVTSGEESTISAGGGLTSDLDSQSMHNTGGNQPHNNIQPSIVVQFWQRVPLDYVETPPQNNPNPEQPPIIAQPPVTEQTQAPTPTPTNQNNPNGSIVLAVGYSDPTPQRTYTVNQGSGTTTYTSQTTTPYLYVKSISDSLKPFFGNTTQVDGSQEFGTYVSSSDETSYPTAFKNDNTQVNRIYFARAYDNQSVNFITATRKDGTPLSIHGDNGNVLVQMYNGELKTITNPFYIDVNQSNSEKVANELITITYHS